MSDAPGQHERSWPRSKIEATGESFSVGVSEDMLGRIIDGLGNVIDGKGPINNCTVYPVENNPPNPLTRMRISECLPSRHKGY